MICIKCREEHEGDHECLEEMTIDELYEQPSRNIPGKIRGALDQLGEALGVSIPTGQDPNDKEFKP